MKRTVRLRRVEPRPFRAEVWPPGRKGWRESGSGTRHGPGRRPDGERAYLCTRPSPHPATPSWTSAAAPTWSRAHDEEIRLTEGQLCPLPDGHVHAKGQRFVDLLWDDKINPEISMSYKVSRSGTLLARNLRKSISGCLRRRRKTKMKIIYFDLSRRVNSELYFERLVTPRSGRNSNFLVIRLH